MIDTFKSKMGGWVEGTILNILGDFAELIEGFYPLFVIICLIGIYVSMAGDKKRGSRLSSMSFITYIIVRVMSSVYAK